MLALYHNAFWVLVCGLKGRFLNIPGAVTGKTAKEFRDCRCFTPHLTCGLTNVVNKAKLWKIVQGDTENEDGATCVHEIQNTFFFQLPCSRIGSDTGTSSKEQHKSTLQRTFWRRSSHGDRGER